MSVAFFSEHKGAPVIIGIPNGLMRYPVMGLFADCQHIRYDGFISDTGYPFYTALKVNLGRLYGLMQESLPFELLLDWKSQGSGFTPPPSGSASVAYFADHRDKPAVVGGRYGPVEYPLIGLYGDAQHVDYQGNTTDDGGFFYSAIKFNFGQIYSLSEETVSFDFMLDWTGTMAKVWMGAYKNLETSPFNGAGKGEYLTLDPNPVPIRIDGAGQIRSLQLRFIAISGDGSWEISKIEGRVVRQPRAGV